MSNGKRSFVKPLLRLVVLLLVSWGIYHSAVKARRELAAQQTDLVQKAAELRESAAQSESPKKERLLEQARKLEGASTNFWQPNPLYLALGILLYAVGMIPSAFYWKRCLRTLGQRTRVLETLWAYFLGNLGKYFPGKAMVLVLRVDALKHRRVHKAATVVSIFMETLTLMAVGGAIAAVALIILNVDWRLTLAASGLLMVTFVPTIPPVLRRVIRLIKKGLPSDELDRLCKDISWRNTLIGWLYLSISWAFMCGSLLAILNALPTVDPTESGFLTTVLAVAAACSLAVVLGFVSLIPGGAGVREVVLSLILTPVVGPVAALSTAVWMRLAWLFTELAMVGGLAIARKVSGPPAQDHSQAEELSSSDAKPQLEK